MLVFDVELVDFETPRPSSLPEAPADVAAPPADATDHRQSGLAYKVLTKSGTVHSDHPGADRPRSAVHYTGWTTDGKMFDSSMVPGASRPPSRSTGSSPAGPRVCS